MAFTYDGAPDVPSDPLDYTPEHRRAVVEWFATLPLTELRQRQAIKVEEQGRGYIKARKGEIAVRVLDRIDQQWEQLTDAISLREFGVTMFGSHDARPPARKP